METQIIGQDIEEAAVSWESLEFITNAINDNQGTIRAIDIKLQVIFAFLVVPFSILEKIFSCFDKILNNPNCNLLSYLTILLIIVFWASWFMAIIVAFLGIASIGNPVQHVKNDDKANGAFYLGDIYKFMLWHAVFRFGAKALQSIAKIKQRFPNSASEQKKELVFELAKIAFIRDIKMYRQKVALFLVLIWLFSGGIILFIYHKGV